MAENQVLSETLHFLLLSWNSWRRSQAGRWAIHQGQLGHEVSSRGWRRICPKTRIDTIDSLVEEILHHGMYKTLEIMGYVTYQLVQGFFNQQYYVKNIYMIVCVCNHHVYILQLFKCNFTRQSGHFEPLGLLFFWVELPSQLPIQISRFRGAMAMMTGWWGFTYLGTYDSYSLPRFKRKTTSTSKSTNLTK